MTRVNDGGAPRAEPIRIDAPAHISIHTDILVDVYTLSDGSELVWSTSL